VPEGVKQGMAANAMNNNHRQIAYFSMELALEPGIPTYSGGLGVLAGDTIRSAADMRLPLVAVSLAHRQGYFLQRLDASGLQTEEPQPWPLEQLLTEMPGRPAVTIEGRTVRLRAWRYEVRGLSGHMVPVYLLDSDLPENTPWDRRLTDTLYGGDEHYRLCQEVILGIGGVRMLRALGHDRIRQFHMNEGHASLLALQLLDEEAVRAGRTQVNQEDVEAVRAQCIFTTHTPVPAGHDQFPLDLVTRVLGQRDLYEMKDVFCCEDRLNMTYLALNLSHYVNGVAKRHGLVSQHMFAHYEIDAITNGVHVPSWTSASFERLFDRHIPDWRADNFALRYALSIPGNEVWDAHQQEKQKLIDHINRETGAAMDRDTFTIGFARRATAYKRPDLLFRDLNRLRSIAQRYGGLQVVFAGKAHPQDQPGKALIRQVFESRQALRPEIKLAWLTNYDMAIGRLMTAGVDLWLNTPQPPLEASGTSGMKAALNGVPSLSILDGWWIEGCIEGVTGWAIGTDGRQPELRPDGQFDAASLYDKLEQFILPLFCDDRQHYGDIMRHAIALNGSFFNTQRMLQQYVLKAYFD
jgi:starch phosphorylase